jgi:transposase-like protein
MFSNKTIVFGMMQRNGQVMTKVVPNVAKKTLQPIIEENILDGSVVHTDELKSYKGLKKAGYDHQTVNHAAGEYAQGENHVNKPPPLGIFLVHYQQLGWLCNWWNCCGDCMALAWMEATGYDQKNTRHCSFNHCKMIFLGKKAFSFLYCSGDYDVWSSPNPAIKSWIYLTEHIVPISTNRESDSFRATLTLPL